MNNLTVIGKILNLDLEKYDIEDCIEYGEEKGGILEFHISKKGLCATCPECGTKTRKRQDLRKYKQKKNLKHIVLSDDRIIELKPIKRFFRCNKKGCKKRFLERFDIESSHGFHTHSFEQYVISSWGYMSGNKIAELSKTNASRIYGILQNIDHGKINEIGMKILEGLDEIYLGVDEHSFSGHDMILIITELKTQKLIAVLDGITKEKLESWIWSIPLRIQKKIKGFSTDMNKGYKHSLNKIISDPVHSVDKYHLFQEANRMTDDVRILNIWLTKMNFVKADEIIKCGKIPKKLQKEDIQKINQQSENSQVMQKYKDSAFQRLKTDDMNKNPECTKNVHGETVKYKEITLDYFLEKGYKTLFMKREKNLSPMQKLRIHQIFQEFDYHGYLTESWIIKENFMDAIDERNIQEVDLLIQECKASHHYRIQQFGRTLTNWYDGIKGYCEHSTDEFKFTNAFTEGTNNSCKVAKRQSHGFKLKENYIKKIFTKSMLSKFKKEFFSSHY